MGGTGPSGAFVGSSTGAAGEFRIDEDRPDARTIVLAVQGDADMRTAGELKSRLGEIIDRAPSAVVVDLSGATFLDSMALGVFLSAMRRLRAGGGRFRVVVPRAEIRRIFEMTLLDRVFDLDLTRQEALSAAARPAPGDGRR